MACLATAEKEFMRAGGQAGQLLLEKEGFQGQRLGGADAVSPVDMLWVPHTHSLGTVICCKRPQIVGYKAH